MIKQHLVSQNMTFALLHRRDLVTHEPLGEWSKMAPFRVLSVDIECQGRKGCFPEAEKDAVIQIATTVQQVGDKEPFLRHVLTLNSCAPIAAAQVEAFDREADMLLRCACCPLTNSVPLLSFSNTCCACSCGAPAVHCLATVCPRLRRCPCRVPLHLHSSLCCGAPTDTEDVRADCGGAGGGV